MSESIPSSELTDSISAAMVDLYGRFYGHDRTTATTRSPKETAPT